MRKSIILLLILFVCLMPSAPAESSAYVISYSPDGQTSLVSDGESIYITRNGLETTLHEPNVMAFTWMDNTSVLANRTDYGVLIINVVTAQVFWLGYNPPDYFCDPCNIGGEG